MTKKKLLIQIQGPASLTEVIHSAFVRKERESKAADRSRLDVRTNTPSEESFISFEIRDEPEGGLFETGRVKISTKERPLEIYEVSTKIRVVYICTDPSDALIPVDQPTTIDGGRLFYRYVGSKEELASKAAADYLAMCENAGRPEMALPTACDDATISPTTQGYSEGDLVPFVLLNFDPVCHCGFSKRCKKRCQEQVDKLVGALKKAGGRLVSGQKVFYFDNDCGVEAVLNYVVAMMKEVNKFNNQSDGTGLWMEAYVGLTPLVPAKSGWRLPEAHMRRLADLTEQYSRPGTILVNRAIVKTLKPGLRRAFLNIRPTEKPLYRYQEAVVFRLPSPKGLSQVHLQAVRANALLVDLLEGGFYHDLKNIHVIFQVFKNYHRLAFYFEAMLKSLEKVFDKAYLEEFLKVIQKLKVLEARSWETLMTILPKTVIVTAEDAFDYRTILQMVARIRCETEVAMNDVIEAVCEQLGEEPPDLSEEPGNDIEALLKARNFECEYKLLRLLKHRNDMMSAVISNQEEMGAPYRRELFDWLWSNLDLLDDTRLEKIGKGLFASVWEFGDERFQAAKKLLKCHTAARRTVLDEIFQKHVQREPSEDERTCLNKLCLMRHPKKRGFVSLLNARSLWTVACRAQDLETLALIGEHFYNEGNFDSDIMKIFVDLTWDRVMAVYTKGYYMDLPKVSKLINLYSDLWFIREDRYFEHFKLLVESFIKVQEREDFVAKAILKEAFDNRAAHEDVKTVLPKDVNVVPPLVQHKLIKVDAYLPVVLTTHNAEVAREVAEALSPSDLRMVIKKPETSAAVLHALAHHTNLVNTEVLTLEMMKHPKAPVRWAREYLHGRAVKKHVKFFERLQPALFQNSDIRSYAAELKRRVLGGSGSFPSV